MNIVNILTTVFAVAVEFLIVIYYSNSTMNYRHSRFKSNLYIAIGYSVYAGICIYGNSALNVISGIGILFAVLCLGFSENIGTIALKVIIIMLLSMFGEWITSFLVNIDLDKLFFPNVPALENIIFTLTSKLILYISIVLLRRFSVKRDKIYKLNGILYFLILPVSTMFLLSSSAKICPEISSQHIIVLLLAMTAIIIANFVVYIVYDKLLDKIEKISELQELRYKEKLDYTSYKMIKEKYEELRIMVHNFEKYCDNIEGMISTDQKEAVSLINELKNKNKEFLLVEYTNNKALNILLSQKQQQCSKKGINFQLYIQNIDLSFIKEIDIISIFSNLLDNAIESCVDSENKKIFLGIQMINDYFITIRVDNSCDTEPMVCDGILHTRKHRKEQHGIGLSSVKKSLANYSGNMEWSYNKDSKIFSTTAMISCFDWNRD